MKLPNSKPSTLRNRSSKKKSAPTHPVVTVGALIENKDGNIFLVRTHKWGDRYGIPGGKVEKGERVLCALAREIREETGLVISSPRLLLVQDVIAPDTFYIQNAHYVSLNYHAKTRTTHFTLNDEAQAGIWVDPKAALKLPLNQPTSDLIRAFIRLRKNKV